MERHRLSRQRAWQLSCAVRRVLSTNKYRQQSDENAILREQLAFLEKREKQSVVMQSINAQMEEIADQERRISDEQRDKAEHQTIIAEQMRRDAEEERQNALEAERRAIESSKVAKHQRTIAESQRTIAEQQRSQAEYQQRVADTLSYLTLARQLGDVAIKQANAGNNELADLLAYAAQVFTTRYHGDPYQSSVYKSLMETSKSRHVWNCHHGRIFDVAFYNDSEKRFVSCGSYGELLEHVMTGEKLVTKPLINNNTYDFRDCFVDRQRQIIYVVSRNGHVVVTGKNMMKVIPVNTLGPLMRVEPTGKYVLIFGEKGIAELDPETFDIIRTKMLPFTTINTCFYDKYACLFDANGHMYIVRGIDDIETTQVPVKGQVTAYAMEK